MKKPALLFSFIWLLSLFFGISTKAVLAGAHLYFDPDDGNYTVGQEIKTIVKMDSGGKIIGGADGMGTYDTTRLELISIEESPSLVFNSGGGSGGCSVTDKEDLENPDGFGFSCYSNFNTEVDNDSGELVVFTFKAKAVGTATVKFDCTQDSTTDSNIITSEPVAEILVCSEIKNGSYVITQGSGEATPTTTPDDDDAEETTTESTSDELPKTGGIGATLGLILFGAISVASAVFLKFL